MLRIIKKTQSFFEQQTPDASLYGQSQQIKTVQKYKVLITQPFFELKTPYFAWKFIWTVQANEKV